MNHELGIFRNRFLGCDFFERRGEKRIDVRRFFGYVCHIAKFFLRKNLRWISLFFYTYENLVLFERIDV